MRLFGGLNTNSVLRRVALAGGAITLLGGCQAIALTAAGIGASTGLTHTAGSVSSRTFTANDTQVRQATMVALDKMGVKIEATEKNQTIETIRATVADRSIEIELEVLSATSTRISASAQRGMFVYDGATAREIVAQTKLAMVELRLAGKARGAQGKNGASIADSTMATYPTRR